MGPNHTDDHAATHIDSILAGIFRALILFVPLMFFLFNGQEISRWFSDVSQIPVMTKIARDFETGAILAGDLFIRKSAEFYNDPAFLDLDQLLETAGLAGMGPRRSPGILRNARPGEYTWERTYIENKLSAEFGKKKLRASKKFLDYIEEYMGLASQEMYLSRIPASITLAQGLLESEAGESFLGRTAKNHFGIKCPKYSDYKSDGKIDDDDFYHHNLAYDCVQHEDDNKWDRFEMYRTVDLSYRRHTLLLVKSKRYNWMPGAFHVGEFYPADRKWFGTDTVPYYAAWSIGLKEGGYATSKRYAQKIAYIIETYELWRIDYMVLSAL